LTVSKVITIKLNGYTVEAVDAGAGFAKNTTETQLVFSISPVASTVVSVAVESEIGDNVSPEDTEIISEVINLTQINGVADALSEDGQDKIIAEARVTPGEDDQVVVEISVAVMATESNLAAGTLTFSAMPTANVYLNGTIKTAHLYPCQTIISTAAISRFSFRSRKVLNLRKSSTKALTAQASDSLKVLLTQAPQRNLRL
jgi:hypothetical protein